MKDWHAIDLHLHTVEGVTGDGKSDQVDFSYSLFTSALLKYNLKLVAITNHNSIDMVNYLLCRYLANKIGTTTILGVELDTETKKGVNYHIIALFNEGLLESLKICDYINSNTKTKKTTGKIRYNAEDIVYIVSIYNTLIIPHGNKSKGLLDDADEPKILEALEKIKEGFIRVFDSVSDWKLAQIKQFLQEENLYSSLDDFGGVLFSDVRCWPNYSHKHTDFYMNAEPTFKGLVHSITNPTSRLLPKKLIQEGANYIDKIVITQIDDKNIIVPTTINLKAGYNCIIGKSGSGKSLLLHLIKNALKAKANNTNYNFDKFCKVEVYNEFDKPIGPESVNIGIGVPIFSKIIAANTANNADSMYNVIQILDSSFAPKRKFSKYITNYKQRITKYVELKKAISESNESIKQDLNRFKSSHIEFANLKDIQTFEFMIPKLIKGKYTIEEIENFKTLGFHITSLRTIIKSFKNVDINNLNKSIDSLELELNQIINKINYDSLYEDVYNKKINIFQNAVSKVNAKISSTSLRKNELRIMIPLIGKEIAKNIIQYYKDMKESMNSNLAIDINEIDNENIINSENNIKVTETINPKLITEMNIKTNSIFYTYGSQQRLSSKCFNMTDENESRNVVDEYIRLNLLKDDNIIKMFQDVELDVNVYFDNQNVKELNPGDISKKYIKIYFEKELANDVNTIVLYDQIENDVDKSFINSTIKDLISDMKKKAQVIVVTHEPIIAVNADPVNYIEAKKTNGKFFYRDFVPESSIQNEFVTIAENVDGSIDAIRKRYEIYKGDKSYENINK